MSLHFSYQPKVSLDMPAMKCVGQSATTFRSWRHASAWQRQLNQLHRQDKSAVQCHFCALQRQAQHSSRALPSLCTRENFEVTSCAPRDHAKRATSATCTVRSNNNNYLSPLPLSIMWATVGPSMGRMFSKNTVTHCTSTHHTLSRQADWGIQTNTGRPL